MPGPLRVEFHCHSIFSQDSLTRPEAILVSARRKRIDRVVVTDHNALAGALAAQRLDPETIIPGEEIMTTGGEILAAFVKEEVPGGLAPEEVIHRLREQGAFISLSHPFDRLRSGHWHPVDLDEITPLVDAIEVFNARCMTSKFNQLAMRYSREHHLAGTVGSDAHTAFEVGAAIMILPYFEGPEGLKKVIGRAQFQVRLLPVWVHLASRYANLRKRIRV